MASESRFYTVYMRFHCSDKYPFLFAPFAVIAIYFTVKKHSIIAVFPQVNSEKDISVYIKMFAASSPHTEPTEYPAGTETTQNHLLTYAINRTIIIFAGFRNTCRTGRKTYGKTEEMQKSLPHAKDL